LFFAVVLLAGFCASFMAGSLPYES
jgi:hypothetical protein